MNLLERRRRFIMSNQEGVLPDTFTTCSYIEGTGSQYISVNFDYWTSIEDFSVSAHVYHNKDISRGSWLGEYPFNALFGSAPLSLDSGSFPPLYFAFRMGSGGAGEAGFNGKRVIAYGDFALNYDDLDFSLNQGEYEISFGVKQFGNWNITKTGGVSAGGSIYGTTDNYDNGVIYTTAIVIGGGVYYQVPTDASHVERALVSPFIGKIYEFKIWNKTRLVCHLVPCKRSSDNVYGMYDLVQRKFYTSATNYAYTGG